MDIIEKPIKANPKFNIVSLGCEKNNVDSEGIGQMLRGVGYAATANADEADLLIVNTCGFLEPARREAVATLNQLAANKRPGQTLIAAGCMVELYKDRIQAEVPGLDGQVGARNWPEVTNLALELGRFKGMIPLLPALPQQLAADSALADLCPTPPAADPQLTGFARRATGATAFVKIAEGCNAKCTFCIIPQIRGGHVSKPLPQIINEVKELAAQGVREIIYISQDSTYYGIDLGIREGLAGLLEETARQVPQIELIRIMYAYPARVSPRLIEAMRDIPQVAKYLDMPLQHGNVDTLRRMKRPSNMTRVRQVLHDLRSGIPDLAIRTTFIVGFPGETNAEFDDLVGFINEGWFDHVGVFIYSPEEKSVSYNLEGHLPERVKLKRRKLAMAAQQTISQQRNTALVGKPLRVLIEGEGEIEEESAGGRKRRHRPSEVQKIYVGRSYREAPEVDGYIFIQPRKGQELQVGQFVDATISHAEEYDLWAQV